MEDLVKARADYAAGKIVLGELFAILDKFLAAAAETPVEEPPA